MYYVYIHTYIPTKARGHSALQRAQRPTACLPSAALAESPTGLKKIKRKKMEKKKENMARASHQLRSQESPTG